MRRIGYMAKSKTINFEKQWKKLRKRSKRRYIISIISLVIVTILGGFIVGVLIYLELNGLLSGLIAILKAFLITNEVDLTLVVFWILTIPLVLIFLIAANGIRRLRFKNYRRTWEETAKLAVKEEEQEFRKRQEKLKKVKRFGTLGETVVTEEERPGVKIRSLSRLCNGFRAFAATHLKLYYTPEQIRTFIASLAVSRIIIVQGMSGTGKTSLAYAFGEYIGVPSTIIPVQPMWKERSDLMGYFNEFTKKYNETPLLKKMYEANMSGDIFITVLDEMNIARVEYYFAEFLSLLEIPNPELRYLEVVPDVWEDDPPELKDGRIKLPENMWFIGTANNDDSTFVISDKVYDRAMIIDLDTRTAPFVPETYDGHARITFEQFTDLVENSKRGYEMTKRNERRLKELDQYLIAKYQLTFGNRIMKQIHSYISVYVSCGGDELDALDDMLCRKVLRKLTYKDAAVYRKDLRDTIKFIDNLFGADRMPECHAFLNKMAK